MDAVHNARLVANAEQYYRIMYYGSRASWNLRDSHMFETLKALLAFHGTEARRSSGRTIPTLGMPQRPRCCPAAKTISAISAGRNSATDYSMLDLAPTAAWWQLHPIGMVRWRSSPCLPSIAESYERCCHDTGIPSSVSISTNPRSDGRRTWESRASSAQSASSIGRRRNLPATISRRSCRNNSTSTSGLTKPWL